MKRLVETVLALKQSIMGLCALGVLLAMAGFVFAPEAAAVASAATRPTCTTSCVTEYPVPTPVVYNGPFGIARGFADDMWFGDQDTIGRIDRNVNIVQYTVPSPGAGVGWVTRGTDGGMWFVERFTDKLGRVDNLGHISEFQIPTANSLPQGVVMADNGIVWFTEQVGNKLGRLDPSTGSFTEYAVPTPNAGPLGLALGPDGALWFTERNASQIGRMDQQGTFTEYPLTPGSSPQRITVGLDGALWFTELTTSRIGRITTDGQLTEYPLAAGSGPVGITVGSFDDALWIAEFGSDKIARMTLDGTVTNEFNVSSPAATPFQIAAGSNLTFWFTESFLSPNGNKIGVVRPFGP
jgi:virginiamycin B lyase